MSKAFWNSLSWSKPLNQQLLIALLLGVVSLFCAGSVAKEKEAGFAGLEFFGSSQTSRPEIDKVLHLKPGATVETTEKAVERLQLDFDKRNVKGTVELVPDSGEYFIVVDVAETGYSNKTVNRRLIDSHHIYMQNEKPMDLLLQLKARMQKLVDEGRATSERYQDGIRLFGDAPCLNLAESLMKSLQGQRPYIFKILASDPNGERRAMAADLLNWCEDPVGNCAELIPALDDSDVRVRMAASKYIWARIDMLPSEFPYQDLVDGLSRQLARPSHHDRVRALASLIALAKHDGDSVILIKAADEAKLKEIVSTSVIPSVQNSARQLLSFCTNPPAPKRHQSIQAPDSAY